MLILLGDLELGQDVRYNAVHNGRLIVLRRTLDYSSVDTIGTELNLKLYFPNQLISLGRQNIEGNFIHSTIKR
jgi:hypothetical protein